MFVYKNLDADPLRYVLDLAYRQAMAPDGKGMTRHGSDKPFREQISSVITRLVGIGYPLGQALKKRDEASRLEKEAAIRELLGAINYLAMVVIHLLTDEDGKSGNVH
jgi:hypothetical protein